MKTQCNTQNKPVEKLKLKKTSIRVLTFNVSNYPEGPTANCSNPC